jgi:hypothetical protein
LGTPLSVLLDDLLESVLAVELPVLSPVFEELWVPFLSCEPVLSLPLEDFEFEAVVEEESLLEEVFEFLPSLFEEVVEAVDEEPPEVLPLEPLDEPLSEAVCDDLFESLEPLEDLELVEAVEDLPSVDFEPVVEFDPLDESLVVLLEELDPFEELLDEVFVPFEEPELFAVLPEELPPFDALLDVLLVDEEPFDLFVAVFEEELVEEDFDPELFEVLCDEELPEGLFEFELDELFFEPEFEFDEELFDEPVEPFEELLDELFEEL